MSNVRSYIGLVISMILLGLSCPRDVHADDFAEVRGTLWEPCLEWTLDHSTYEGNPFDIRAEVLFTHEESRHQIRSLMFYDGNGRWKFRFTGVRTGRWSFETASDVDALDDHSGTVVIAPNPDSSSRGFIRADGNTFVRHGPGEDELDGFVPNIWMNYREWGDPYRSGWTKIASTFADSLQVEAFLDDAEHHGSNGIHAIIANQWFAINKGSYDEHDSENPDLEAFRVLERTIRQAHRRGMFLHIWMWGDEARRWTPVGLTGGINGESDRRLQRYIAARLGPLPGWMMSYGFDLNEWVSQQQTARWIEYMDRHMGWQHLLGAREREEFISPQNAHYLSHDERFTAQPEDNRRFYDKTVRWLTYAGDRPLMYERRFAYRRDSVWSDKATRRARWQFVMAGGAGSIWGYYPPASSAHEEGSYDPVPLRTHRRFWRRHFIRGMERANSLSENGWVLREGQEHFVFYAEQTSTLHMNLSSTTGPLRATAVDVSREYEEIDLGMLSPGDHRWTAPRRSDWVIAVGEF